jgi:hypothetical protein
MEFTFYRQPDRRERFTKFDWSWIKGTKEGAVKRAGWNDKDQDNNWFLYQMWARDYYVVENFAPRVDGFPKKTFGPFERLEEAVVAYRMLPKA